MAIMCIDKLVAERLKQAVRSGEISIDGLYNMTSAQRRAAWQKHVSPELAQHINAHFEQAMLSRQKDALQKWVKDVFQGKAKKTAGYKSVMDRIENLDKIGVLDTAKQDNFLADLAADRLGFSVTAEEVQEISKRAVELQGLFLNKDEFGLPEMQYWVKRKALEDYVDSLNPTHNVKILTSLVGRGNLLFSVKSPATNIISNTVMAGVNAIERRLASGTLAGPNPKLAAKYVWKVNQIFQKTGYDISRMVSLSEGQRRRGEQIVHSQGKGAVRAVGRFYEDIVFKQLMGAPDVASSSLAFADFVNIESGKVAKQKGLDAKKVMLDAMSLNPQTAEGEAVRALAIAEAEYTTYTNNGKYSHLAIGFRNLLNEASGDLRLGDLVMPFVKTPANVVQSGIDAAGLGALESLYKLPEAIRQYKEGDGAPMREVVRGFVRSGMGLTLALILAFAFDPDDYIPDYDVLLPKERELVEAKNASYNSIKIGNKYVSLDYFGPIAAAFVGIMYARKAESAGGAVLEYGRGVVSQSLKIPGVREMTDLMDSVIKAVKDPDPKKTATGIAEGIFDAVRARAIPAIVGDTAKATDSVQRQPVTQVDKITGLIPGASQTLPAKSNRITGEDKESEGFVSTLIFGSRLKTATDDPLVDEVVRLHDAGQSPAISNLEYTSSRMKDLKAQIGAEKFNKAMDYFSDIYGGYAKKLIKSPEYKRAGDVQKKDALDRIRSNALTATLNRFGYQKNRGLKQ